MIHHILLMSRRQFGFFEFLPEKMFLLIALIFTAFHVSAVQGLLQASVSLNIKDNINMKTTGWYKLSTWQSPPETGHIIMGTTVANGNVNIPYSGMYLAFITVTLNGADGKGRFKVKFVINDKINSSRSCMTSSLLGAPLGPKSLSVKGVVLLQTNDFASVYVYSESDSEWSITGQSQTTFSLQYINALGIVPGFSALIQSEAVHNSSSWVVLREWRHDSQPGLFKSMTGFSKHTGEFVALCSGIYIITANMQIKTNATGFFDLGIAINSIVNGSTMRSMPSREFTLSLATTVRLNKGDVITSKINSYGQPFVIGIESSFSAVRVRSYSTVALGFSTVLEHDITGNGGGWVELPLQLPNGTSFGQFKEASSNSIASGRYYTLKDGIFIISASIHVVAESLVSATLLTRVISGSSISSNIVGIYSGTTKSDYQNEVTFSTSGTIRLSKTSPLFFYFYMQNAGRYRLLAGSRISIVLADAKYPAFHATLDTDESKSSADAWLEVSTWKTDKAVGAVSLTDSLSASTGRYTADIAGIYLVSSNIIFKTASATVISMLISINGGQSKRDSLFSTKGNPAGTDTLSTSGALRLTKGQYVSVWVKVTGTPSWNVGARSSFSATFLGLPFSVPGFSTVFLRTQTFISDGWNQLRDLWQVSAAGPLFSYGGGLDTTNCRYQTPVSGIYMVSANLKLKQATRVTAEFILNVAIDKSPSTYTYLNGINDYVLRSTSLGSEDFYSMNVAGVVMLKPNQNVTLWIKSTSAGTWQLSQDSTFSVVLIHQENDLHASGFQAALSTSLSQTVTGATSWKIIRNWQTTRGNSGAGLFKLEKYQNIDGSSGTVTVKESGLYFISALVTLKDAVGKFEVGIHLESQLAGLFSIVDSSRLSSYTIRIFGLLYIPENNMFTVMVRASIKKNWEQDMRFTGLSFVKLSPLVIPPTFSSTTFVDNSVPIFDGNWTKVHNWRFSENPSQYFIGNGFAKETGVFTTKNDGIYIASGFLEVAIPNTVTDVEMRMALNVDTKSVSIVDTGNGVSTMVSKCNESCLLHASAVLHLKGQETVSVFVKSNNISQLTIRNSSMFSLLLVSESLPLPNGLHGMLSTALVISVKGNKQVTGWHIIPSTGGFHGSTGDMSNFLVKSTGIFFMSIVIKFKNLVGMARAFTSIVNIPAITAVFISNSDSTFVLSVSGCMKMSVDSFYTVTVYSETDTAYEILAGSSKSAIFLGSSPEGFTATQARSTPVQLKASSANYITGWSTTGKDWLFESGPGFADRSSYKVQKTGVYYVMSNIILSGIFSSSGIHITLTIENDGFIKPEKGLFSKKMLNGTTTDTLSIAGNVYLEKWMQLKLVILVSQTVTVDMNIDSTLSIVKINKELGVEECRDEGPRIIGKLTPEVLRTSFRKPVSWKCEALGESVTYSWMKDYKVISGATSSSFQIASTQVADTGEYICVAMANGMRATSNIAKLTIYDPMPEFINPVADFNLSVPENGQNVLGILFIQARARSFSNNFARMSFSIISGNINNTFALSSSQSEKGVTLMRQRQLDREKRDNYTIVVTATNMEAYAVASQQINITVTDLNDNVPKFTQAVYESSIYENTTIGSTVAKVSATDMDIGINAFITFWFIPSSGGNVFAINEHTGYVTLQGPIDRETRDLYVIFVRASDINFSTFSELRIRILDLNEHAPVFKPLQYVSRISETLLPGSAVATVTASDNDTGVNAELTYDIIDGDPNKVFRITKYGVIQNQKPLDYETNTTYLLKVSVRDNGQPFLYSNETATVMVHVSDANDNTPRFSQSNYVVNLFENITRGIVILTVHATDNDAKGQPESTLTYTLEASQSDLERFIINSTNGAVILNTTLDYEKTKSYRLTVTAKDAGVPSLQDKAQIIINVIDVNDNRPYFTESKVVINVTESSQISRDIYKVTAFDKDSGLNAELRYSLQSGNIGNTFTVDPVSGRVMAMNSLDHERTSYYKLEISCRDLGDPQLTSQSYFTMIINVQDENDNSPSFDSEKYSAGVPENTGIGSVILKMKVSDPDSGANGNFSLAIKGSAQNVFTFSSERSLVLNSKLDYEIQSHYQFSVVAKDYGTPSLEKSASVEIFVTDVNDNIPSFSQSQYDTQLPEMVYANVTVFQMIARDPDLGPGRRLSYEIVSGNSQGQFKIGKYDGIVETVVFINTTFVTTFKLEIVAKDSFTPPAVSNRTLLNIHVTKTPTISVSKIVAGVTSLEATIDVSEFSYLKIVKYELLVQEYFPEDPNFNMAATLPPITWYNVNVNPTALNRIRRYAAIAINVTSTKRKRRSIGSTNMIASVIGNEIGCEKKTGANDMCNGPLQSNKKYRVQVRGYVLNSKFPRDSYFSVPIQLGNPASTSSNVVDPSIKDGTIGLTVAFASSTILTVILFIAYVQYKKRHQITDLSLVNNSLQMENPIYNESLTHKNGFDSLSDIGAWPKMPVTSESQLLQQSHGAKEKFLQIPRSPGDSGINHVNDDDDSWKMSDDEGWENQNSRRGDIQMASSLPAYSLQSQTRRLRGISDSNTSLDTNADIYHSSSFSQNLRHIFNNDENKSSSMPPRVQPSKIKDDNEMETEFGPELETSFGADADLSSIDEEMFEDE